MTETLWQRYVAEVTGDRTQTAMGKLTGVGQTTIGRWINGEKRPTDAAKVAQFATRAGRNVLEAFVAAGMLTVEQAGQGLSAASIEFLEWLSDSSSNLPLAALDPIDGIDQQPGEEEGDAP